MLKIQEKRIIYPYNMYVYIHIQIDFYEELKKKQLKNYKAIFIIPPVKS